MHKEITIIAIMCVATFPFRILPLYIQAEKVPKWLDQIIEYIPVAVVSAITLPSVLGESSSRMFITPELVTGLSVLAISYFTKNLIISVLSGLVIYSLMGILF